MHRSSRRNFLKTTSLTAGALTVSLAGPAAALDAIGTDREVTIAAEPMRLARVWVTRDTAHLIGEFDDTHNVFDDGSVEILLWPGDLGRLAATGLAFEITVHDLVARDAAERENAVRPAHLLPQPGETATGDYRTYEDFVSDMQMLAEQNPDICELKEMPELSLEGRTVYYLEIAEHVAKKDGRPVYYNDGIHHAREWPAAEMPIMWAFDLIDSYRRATGEPERAYSSSGSDANDQRMLNIMRHSRNVICPIVNVDGYRYSRNYFLNFSLQGVVTPYAGQYWRKNMRNLDPTGTSQGAIPESYPGTLPGSPGAYGIDCNRNYSYNWGGNGSSGDPTSATYRGSEPFSEPEARNVQFIHRTYQCVSGITHHTSGDLVLWAWGDTHDAAPDDVLLARLGFACGDYNGYRPTKSIDLYVTTGTCSDYTYGTWGSISYTFEHAGSSFHPPYETVVPLFYANNREALMLMCELVCLEPEQRSFMLDAVNNYVHPELGTNEVLRHLTGDFEEVISGTEYFYTGNPLDLTARHHSVITGRLVDADGNGVKGTLALQKDFTNPLTDPSITNLNQHDATGGGLEWPELMDSVIETEDDGSFRWITYPSTRPFVAFEGGQQFVALQAMTDAGSALVGDILLARGDVKDLGDIVVS